VDPTQHRRRIEISEPPAGEEGGWSRLLTFPLMLVTLIWLLWRGRRDGRGGDRAPAPDVPYPRVFE
jgi:hypothetical protein